VTGSAETRLITRESSFIIAAASEIMAILALATILATCASESSHHRASARTAASLPAEDLRVAGAMTVLLKDALLPNIVQTMEGQPALCTPVLPATSRTATTRCSPTRSTQAGGRRGDEAGSAPI